ncbi:MAG: phosphomannose isomerase type II C-terminal cupin domain [Candidatus Campbellbacteria bacterium]|nr:phosphomannose isomerase type II C-terminal cupin domain [Candidatus Campbellbacteria bacterium]
MQKPFDTQRPWGSFREFTTGEPVTVKLLFVRRGEELSLQRHIKRSEFWRIISGTPHVIVGENETDAHAGDEFDVPAGTEHRISASNNDVECLEISYGMFDENDIVREQDKYGRA